MPYYPTLTEDIKRAKEILAKGKADVGDVRFEQAADLMNRVEAAAISGGTIYGADTYAAYKLLESFVEAIEAVGPKVCELALRHHRMANQPEHIPGCTCIVVNGEYRSTEVRGCPFHEQRQPVNHGPRQLKQDGTPLASITCPRCHMTSYHPKDVSERFCGNCKRFHDEMRAE